MIYIYMMILYDIISFSTCTSCVSLFFHRKSLCSLIGSEMIAGGAPPPNNIRPSGAHRAHRECPSRSSRPQLRRKLKLRNSTSKIEIDRNCNDQKDQKEQRDQRFSWSRHCNAMSCNGLPGDFDEFRVNFVSGTLAIRKYRRTPQLINEYNTHSIHNVHIYCSFSESCKPCETRWSPHWGACLEIKAIKAIKASSRGLSLCLKCLKCLCLPGMF